MSALPLAPSAAQRANRYEALLRVLQLLTAQRDPAALFQALASELRHVVAFDGISLVVYDEATHTIRVHLLEIVSPSGEGPPADVPPEETLSWWVYQHQQPLVISCVETETRFPHMMRLLQQCGVRSVCGLPLTTVHRRLGGLCLGSVQPDAYSEEEVGFLSLVADQIALAIDDALNFEAAQRVQAELLRNNDRLKLILDLTNSLVSNLELRELLRAISASVRRVMQCDVVGVALPDAEGARLRVYALDFPDSKGFIQEGVLLPIEGSPLGTVFRTGKPALHGRPDPTELAPEVYRMAAGEGFASGCTLPLISRHRILGTLSLGRRQEHAFTQEDVDFLMQVASQVAIAIENALAYGQVAELKDQLAQEKLYLEDEIRSEMHFEEIVGKSAALRRVLQAAQCFWMRSGRSRSRCSQSCCECCRIASSNV